MNIRKLLNLLLLFVVIALISLTLQTVDNKHATTNTLLNIKRNDINKIKIFRKQGDIILNKINNEWLMEQPYTIRAHKFRIEMLLDLLDTTIDHNYEISQTQLTSFGLDTPRASILFNEQLIHFGKTNPVSGKRYIQTVKFIALIEDQLYPLISSQPSSFVDLKLLSKSQRISGLHLPDFSVTQQDAGPWVSTKEARPDQIQTLLDHWQHAQAFAVHAYVPRKQLGTIRLELASSNILEFELSDTSPWLILGNQQLGIEYHFDSAMYSRLFSFDQPASLAD